MINGHTRSECFHNEEDSAFKLARMKYSTAYCDVSTWNTSHGSNKCRTLPQSFFGTLYAFIRWHQMRDITKVRFKPRNSLTVWSQNGSEPLQLEDKLWWAQNTVFFGLRSQNFYWDRQIRSGIRTVYNPTALTTTAEMLLSEACPSVAALWLSAEDWF